MKKILISLIGLIGILGFVACDDETPEVRQERKVFYTHSEGAGLPAFSGTTVRLTTDAEWDALLDRFCDYAQDGELVTFCSTNSNYQAKGNSSATPTSITTGDREELKKWMKEMERSGRTVNVTYDANTGVWSGTAYANLGGNTTSTAEELTYTGILTAAPMPVLEQPSINGSVLALQTSDDNTLIIATHGMMLLIEDSTDFSVFRYINISLNGCVYQHYDLDGQIFLVLELSENQDNVLSL